MHRVVVVPFAAPDESLVFEDFDDLEGDTVFGDSFGFPFCGFTWLVLEFVAPVI